MNLPQSASTSQIAPVLWQPQAGPQTMLLSCPIREICYGGARGGGKTDGMLGHWLNHFIQHQGLAQGIFFRRKYKQLDRVRVRGLQLLKPLGFTFLSSGSDYMFVHPNGARLLLRHLKSTEDADEYQGHEYNWMCFEEATQWPMPTPIDRVRAANRDSNNVPCWFLLTCNPGGAGHQWVKDRYITPDKQGYRPIHIKFPKMSGAGFVEKEAVYLPAKVWDNKKLLDSQPEYINNLYLSGAEWLVRAWLAGDWDIIAGGFLEGIWKPERHIVKPFIPPTTWPRFRALDWGFAAPYSVGWYATNPDTKKIYRYRELYGYGGQPNVGTREDALAVRAKILEIEAPERKAGIEFRRNPADRSIWNEIGSQQGIIDLFHKGKCNVNGQLVDEKCLWIKGSNGPNSREGNNQIVVSALKNDQFAVTSDCKHFLRTVPPIPADEDNHEDVDTDAEDHVFDEFKMALASRRRTGRSKPIKQEDPAPFSGTFIESIKDGKFQPIRARPSRGS